MAYKYFIKGIRRFNAEKVQNTAKELFLSKEEDFQLMIRSNKNENDEVDSYTVLTDEFSTQGVNLSFRIDGQVILELPWLASIMDVRFCYAYLKAVKKVHRTARIVDENGKDVKTTDEDAKQQWFVRCDNMAEIIEKGEDLTVKGWHRDFHVHPKRYDNEVCIEDKVYAAFGEFAQVQWMSLGYDDLPEEHRHVIEEEELSSIRVIDKTKSCFIGSCTYVGLTQGNSCKMVRLQDFYSIMEDNDFFSRLDDKQAILDPMPEEMWSQLYDRAEGIVKENFRKTFIMRWNTDISNYKLCEFEEAMEDFCDESFYYNWSIWDYQKAHIGDKFFMIRTGEGKRGVVMRGTIIGTPYPDEDWSGKGRKVYYIRMRLSHMIHPDKSPLMLTTEELSKAIPEFSWEEGHSGVILDDTTAMRLDEVWNDYVEKVHQMAGEEDAATDFNDYYKEKGWEKITLYQSHGDHIDCVIDLDKYLDNMMPEIGKWPLCGSSHTNVSSDDYFDEEADILAVKTGDEMGFMALFLNNEKRQGLDFITCYPCLKGIKHSMTIKKVFEWDNQIEAIVWADMEELSLAFFATDYFANKDRYVPGMTPEVDLAALAYKIEEGEREILIEGETAEYYRKSMEIEKKYDNNGNLLPVVFYCDQLVAYLNNDDARPDDAGFASPVEEIEEIRFLDADFFKAKISICHEPDETYVPLYFKKELLPNAEKGTLLRGYLWMQGQINQ